jgi:hypothetical protein
LAKPHNSKSTLIVKSVSGGKKNIPMFFGHAAGPARLLNPDLPPICRCVVSSQPAIFTASQSLAQGTQTFIADPTGTVSGALGVFQWSTRFSGFQQYRIEKTEWHIVPIRQNVGTVTSSQAPGIAIAWIDNDPNAGAPSQAVALASMPRARIVLNSDKQHEISYTANEPQDLNLADISLPPTHDTGGGILNDGQHCMNIYTDNGFFGLDVGSGSGTVQLLYVQAHYHVAFYGIGGV